MINDSTKLSKSQIKKFYTLSVSFSEIRGTGPKRMIKWANTKKCCTDIYDGMVKIISKDLGTPHGLLLKNCLSDSGVRGLKWITIMEVVNQEDGWNKGGAISGSINK